MHDDEYLGQSRSVPATPWSKGSKLVVMTEQAWYVYHSAWIVCYGVTAYRPDPVDVAHLERARSIAFG